MIKDSRQNQIAFVALITVSLSILSSLIGIETAHSAGPRYEWVQIPSNTYPDLFGRNNFCGATTTRVQTCNSQASEGMVVRMYGVGQVGDRLGQGWSETLSNGNQLMTYQGYANCTHKGGTSAGPGNRVYECKNVGSPEPPPPSPPEYQWVKIGGQPAFQPDMRGQYTSLNFRVSWDCGTKSITAICDGSSLGKMAIAEYKATGFVLVEDRGPFFQGFSGVVNAGDPSQLSLSGFNLPTCTRSGAPNIQNLGAGYNKWEAWQCQSSAASPIGFQDILDCNYNRGWTCDMDDYNQALQVHFYKDGPAGSGGTFIGATTANTTRGQGVADACGGNPNHGFVFSTPEELKDDTSHSVYAYAINIGTGKNILLSGSPKNVTCAAPPTWAVSLDAVPNSGDYPLSVELTATGTGTATDGITWQFDCDGNDSWDDTFIGFTGTQKFNCSLSPDKTYIAKVTSTRQGVSVNATTTITVTVPPPPVITIDSTTLAQNFCGTTGGGFVNFTYVGIGEQRAYELQIDDDSGFTSPIINTGKVDYSGGNPGTMSVTANFVAGREYHVQARAWDSLNRRGPWSLPTTTFRHPPIVSISIAPDPPFAGSPFIATDQTDYGESSSGGRYWDMGDGKTFGSNSPPSGGGASVTHTYTDTDPKTITLTVQDAFGTECADSLGVSITDAIPGFKEVLPR